MDYKFILLVIMILALIYIITTGFNNLKMQIIHVRDITLDRLRVSSDDLKLRVDGNIGRCIKEVGESNIKFLEQIRKIDNITRQKITNETENYTETESNKKGDEKFSYFMSDVSQNNHASSDKDLFKVNLFENNKKTTETSKNIKNSSTESSILIDNKKRLSSDSSKKSESNSDKKSESNSGKKSESNSDKKSESNSDKKSESNSDTEKPAETHDTIISDNEADSVSNSSSDNSSESSTTTIDFETITVGTVASGKGKKPNISIGKKNDKEVVNTIDVNNLTAATLGKVENYKIDELKNIHYNEKGKLINYSEFKISEISINKRDLNESFFNILR